MRTGRSRIRLAAVTLLAAAVVFGAVPSAFAERTIALSTGTIELALAPGGNAAESLVVANNGDEPLMAFVYTNDVTYDAAGAPTYTKPTGAVGEINKSPASWLTLRMPADTQVIANTPYIELAPGEEMIIDFEMDVPQQATPGDYNAIIFFEMFDKEAAAGATSQVSGRIGARISLRVAGDVVDRLEIAPYSVRGLVIGDTVPWGFRIANDGNIDKRMTTSLVVLDGSENEKMRSVVESESIVYAGSARDYSGGLELEGVSFGKYTLRVEVAYEKESGTDGAKVPDEMVKDRTFWVFPLWFVILLIIAVGVPALWLSWRSAQRASTHRDSGKDEAGRRRSRAPGDTQSHDRTSHRPASREAAERAERRREAAERLRHIDDDDAPPSVRPSAAPRDAGPVPVEQEPAAARRGVEPEPAPVRRSAADDDWADDLLVDPEA